MATFEKMRVSLTRDEPGDILKAALYEDRFRTKSEYLFNAFAQTTTFLYRGKPYEFRPFDAPEGYVAGFFSKPSPQVLNHADLTPYTAENFEAALFVMKVDVDQVMWMENSYRVGSPKRILESFFDHLLKKTELVDWRAFVRYFEESEDYWNAVEKYRDQISQIVFRYVPPNAFEGKKLAQKYKTAVQEEANSEVLEERFKSAPGKMNPGSPMMEANAEIAEQGAGEKELRGPKNELLYSSGQGRKTEKVEEQDMPDAQNTSFVSRVIAKLFG